MSEITELNGGVERRLLRSLKCPGFQLTDGISGTKGELETVGLVLVKRIRVQNLDVHQPLLKIVRLHDRNSGR
jgi:hypothetical protein